MSARRTKGGLPDGECGDTWASPDRGGGEEGHPVSEKSILRPFSAAFLVSCSSTQAQLDAGHGGSAWRGGSRSSALELSLIALLLFKGQVHKSSRTTALAFCPLSMANRPPTCVPLSSHETEGGWDGKKRTEEDSNPQPPPSRSAGRREGPPRPSHPTLFVSGWLDRGRRQAVVSEHPLSVM